MACGYGRTMGGVTTTFTWDIAGGLPVVLDDGARYVYGAGLVSQVSGANTYVERVQAEVRQ